MRKASENLHILGSCEEPCFMICFSMSKEGSCNRGLLLKYAGIVLFGDEQNLKNENNSGGKLI